MKISVQHCVCVCEMSNENVSKFDKSFVNPIRECPELLLLLLFTFFSFAFAFHDPKQQPTNQKVMCVLWITYETK